MKIPNKLNNLLRGFALGAAVLAAAPMAKAANAFFTTAVTNTGTYSWDAANWGTASTGPFTSTWTAGNFPEFTSANSYIVTVNASESLAGVWQKNSGTVTINDAGSHTGSLSLVTGNQGVLLNGGLIVNVPITGAGGIQPQFEAGSPSLSLFGTNTFTGACLFTSTSTLINFNNNSSFGAGGITPSTTTVNGYIPLLSQGGALITIPNNITNLATVVSGVNFASAASTPVTLSGKLVMGSSAQFLLRNNGNSTAPLTLNGVISGTAAAGIAVSGANGATIVFGNANTYTGTTQIGVSGATAITLEIGAAASIKSTVVTNAGILKLDAATCLNTNTALQLPASPAAGSVNLNFTGTQNIASLTLGGVVQVGGTYGAVGSGAANQSATFTGTGLLSVPAAASIITQPTSVAVLNGGTATFTVGASGAPTLLYQWYSNNVALAGATSASLVLSPVDPTFATSYKVVVSNSVNSVTSSVVTLTVVESNSYTSAVIADSPLAYYRLDETSGTTAYDVIGGHNGFYKNTTLGVPGFSIQDTDTAVGFPGTGTIPPYGSTNGFVIISNSSAFNFLSASNFTLEAWVMFTNFTGSQRILSSLSLTANGGYAFGIGSSTQLKFTTGGVQDATVGVPALALNTWYHLVFVDSGNAYQFYLNGQAVGGSILATSFTGGSINPLQIGCNPTNYFTTKEKISEQLQGYVDEVAIYGTAVSAGDILNHYTQRYSPTAPAVGSTPLVSPVTNYVSLSTTLTENAAGQNLVYQWYGPAGLISGANNSTYTIPNVALTDAGSYYVVVNNSFATNTSATTNIYVVPIPTNASQLNITNALVLHLPFDTDLKDISGRQNNGTNVGATSFTTGIIGTGSLTYSSDGAGTFNYVTLGKPVDLQFGATTNFTVSFWIQQNTLQTNLPFFSDEAKSTSGTNGFAFAPYQLNAFVGGGWQWQVGDGGSTASAPSSFTSFPDSGTINDGNWHSLVFVADRNANMTTFLDGVNVDAEAISFVGNITPTNVANMVNVGQDGTGTYNVAGGGNIDDLGVWQRALSDFEVAGIYVGGKNNGISFAPTVANPPTYVTLSITNTGSSVILTWPAGTLQSSTVVTGPYTPVVGATSPYTTTASGAQVFYRVHP